MDVKYRIAWKSLDSDFTGHGDYCLSKDEADAWILKLNSKYPELEHWVEMLV
jgi:hypothetical protein